MVHDVFHVNKHITGVVLLVLTFAVIVGGLKSIARVSGKVIPAMAVLFILANVE
jgi:AGCS family alanine or glycine:cation symporter